MKNHLTVKAVFEVEGAPRRVFVQRDVSWGFHLPDLIEAACDEIEKEPSFPIGELRVKGVFMVTDSEHGSFRKDMLCVPTREVWFSGEKVVLGDKCLVTLDNKQAVKELGTFLMDRIIAEGMV